MWIRHVGLVAALVVAVLLGGASQASATEAEQPSVAAYGICELMPWWPGCGG